MNTTFAFTKLLRLSAVAALCLSLQACIDRDAAPDNSGGTTGGDSGGTTGGDTGGGTPGVCNHLPASTTRYKGGDTLGEELSLTLNPSSLAYTITVDASVQRSAGTQRSGTLTQLDDCTYSSAENGAVFTLGRGGVVQGGIAEPSGSSFAPLLAFASTYNNAATPAVFNDVALIFNAAGVQSIDGIRSRYGGAGRLRNAGTMQFCIGGDDGGFMTYVASCSNTQRGYITWNATREAFDFYDTTSVSESAVTTGGTLSGSIIIAQVDGTTVPLMLVRESATRYGLRLMNTQQTALTDAAADGDYVTVDSSGGNGDAQLSGTTLTRGSSSGTLAYNAPVSGVVQLSGDVAGHLLYAAGIYGLALSSSGGPAFELGLRP